MRGSPINDRIERQHFLASNTEKAGDAWASAKRQGMKEPVILVIDARDPHGSELVRAEIGGTQVAAHVAEMAATNLIPMYIIAVERHVAAKTLNATTPNGKNAITKPGPPNCFLAVGMANGGKSYAWVPFPPRTS